MRLIIILNWQDCAARESVWFSKKNKEEGKKGMENAERKGMEDAIDLFKKGLAHVKLGAK